MPDPGISIEFRAEASRVVNEFLDLKAEIPGPDGQESLLIS
jgi:hypothetical protein